MPTIRDSFVCSVPRPILQINLSNQGTDHLRTASEVSTCNAEGRSVHVHAHRLIQEALRPSENMSANRSIGIPGHVVTLTGRRHRIRQSNGWITWNNACDAEKLTNSQRVHPANAFSCVATWNSLCLNAGSL